MAIESYQTQLERVQQTIADIETRGQSWSVDDRAQTRADLPALYRRETWLRKMVERESIGGIRVTGITPQDG